MADQDQFWAPSFDGFSEDSGAAALPADSPHPNPNLTAILTAGLPPPDEPDLSPFSERLELPSAFVPFEKTIASVRLAEFCRTELGYDPVYAGGKVQALTGMAALKTVLGISDADPGNSLFE
jgi:hypothetical protein